VNTSPLGGRDGKYVTSRQIKARLEREVLGNVSIEVHHTESGDTFEVRGRGELQLAVLIEQMRREGYELTVSRPEVILHEVDGEVHEPYERITIDIPPDFIGEVQQALAGRKGRLEQMTTPTGVSAWSSCCRSAASSVPRASCSRHPRHGAAAPDRRGLRPNGRRRDPPDQRCPRERSGRHLQRVTPCSTPGPLRAVHQQRRGVYEGMIVGENARSGDMDVNATKEKKLTNIRTHDPRRGPPLTPPRPLTLESAIEFIGGTSWSR